MDGDFRISLKAARVNAHLTQYQAAKALGVSKQTILGWEHGYSSPTISKAKELAKLYSCPLQWINFCLKD